MQFGRTPHSPARVVQLRRFVLALAAFSALPAMAQPVTVDPADLTPGVTLRVYQLDGGYEKLPKLVEGQTPNVDEVRLTLELKDRSAFGGVEAPLYSTVTGYLWVETAGAYAFRLTTDDGAKLRLGKTVVINNDGRPGAKPKTSDVVQLETGLHPLFLEHFDRGGKVAIKLEWKKPGSDDFGVIPGEALKTANDLARVTSPGVKRVEGGKRAGDGRPVEAAHPGWTVESVAAEGFDPKVGAMAFLPDGRLIVGTFSPVQRDDQALPDIEHKVPDKLYALTGVEGDLSKGVTVKPVADGIFEPMGMCVVDGVLYVAQRKAITRLLDKDGDGFFETHEDVGGGWEAWNYHQFSMGLLHRDGKLYTALSTAMGPPGWEGMGTNSAPNGEMRGSIMEIDLSSNDTRVFAGGTRTPNGLGFGPGGSMFYLDNQGTWMPTSQLAEVIEGRFYGHHNRTNLVPKLADRFPEGGFPSALSDRERTPAAVLLPHGEVSNSPTQPLLIEKGPFAGQMFVGEMTGGGVRRVQMEKVNGQWQGAVFQFTQGLSCGVNRMAWGPDGALYVGGIGALGNWNWKGTKSGLQRLKPNGNEAFEYASMSAEPGGFVVRFTKPVDEAWLADVKHYEMSTWRYLPTAVYGGPKVDQRDLTVKSATPIEDGKGVRLEVSGLAAGQVVALRSDPVAAGGEKIWATEAWYTLNAIPRPEPTPATIAGKAIDLSGGLGVGVFPPPAASQLIAATAEGNFKRGKEPLVTQGRTDAELLKLPNYIEAGKGDLVSNLSFGDARLHVEFFCPPGGEGQLAGNSGVYIQNQYELQVLGTKAGVEPKNNELGSIYQQKAPDVNASTGPGTWQAYDIWFRAPRFADGKKTEAARATIYLNGTLIQKDIEITGPTGSKAKAGEIGLKASNLVDGVQVGPLVLQDHETKAEGPVRFRNVWIAPLTPTKYTAGAWQHLFDGKTLAGWTTRGGEATYTIEPGNAATTQPADALPSITGHTAPNTSNTFLVTEKTYRDFELLLETKQDIALNSGIQIRSHVDGDPEKRSNRIIGYQIELDPSDRAWTGGLYDEGRRGWLQTLVDAPAARRAFLKGEWNRIRVVAHGPVIQTWVNGIPATTAFDALDADGHIALQVHAVGKNETPMTVAWRKLRIRELTAAPAQ